MTFNLHEPALFVNPELTNNNACPPLSNDDLKRFVAECDKRSIEIDVASAAKAKRHSQPFPVAPKMLEGKVNKITHDTLIELLPDRPYCGDWTNAIAVRTKAYAVRKRHIQMNHKNAVRFFTLDVDMDVRDFLQWLKDAGVKLPNFISINPDNGHSHATYVLQTPVMVGENARHKPLHFLADVQRGYTRRLQADQAYSGISTKNPLHPHWRTTWLRDETYTLTELASCLDHEDKVKFPTMAGEFGYGRNCAMFETLRKIAYREYKGSQEALFDLMMKLGRGLNTECVSPMSTAEVRGIARSISRWVYKQRDGGGRARTTRASGDNQDSVLQANRKTMTRIPKLRAIGVAVPQHFETADEIPKGIRGRRDTTAKNLAAHIEEASGKPCSTRTARRLFAEPRNGYEARSLSKLQPWKDAGVSRRTWERRRKAATTAMAA
jgi:hypothetical protein